MIRIFLLVPFADKDAAKALGARWDPRARLWYVTDPQHPALESWPRYQPLPDPLPHEDRQFGAGLFVDLVPQSCWFTNVRSAVAPQDWDRLRHFVYARANFRCELCGADDRLEAHERWDYDPSGPTQILRRLIAVCSACHLATHFGYAQIQGRRDEALVHLMTVNHWSQAEAESHIAAAFRTWRERNAFDWALDLALITDAGIALRDLPDAGTRRARAQHELKRRRPS